MTLLYLCKEVNSICDCRNACYILDQMVEMGFSTDGGMALLQSAFKEAFVVSVVYGKCVDPDSCLSWGFLYSKWVDRFRKSPVTDIIQSVVFLCPPQSHYKESQQQGGVASFVSWVSSGVTSIPVLSLTEKLSAPQQFGWLSYLILDMETKAEESTQLWPCLRTEMANDQKQNLDQALKVI